MAVTPDADVVLTTRHGDAAAVAAPASASAATSAAMVKRNMGLGPFGWCL